MQKAFYLILLVTLISCGSKEESTTEVEIPIELNIQSVKIEAVSDDASRDHVSALGIVKSQNEARVSSKVGGIISKTFTKEGRYVKKGQVLATFLTDELDATVEQAKSGLEKAQRDLDRIKRLYADSVATLEQTQNAGTAVEVASKSLEIAQFNQKHSDAVASISGRVVKQIQYEGELAGPGMPVFVIMGTTYRDWIINAGLVDKDWAKVKIGEKVNVFFDAFPNTFFDGYVSDKSSIGGDASGKLDIEIKLNKLPSPIAAGMVCNVVMMAKEVKNNKQIPIESLVNTNGKSSSVYTTLDGKAVKKDIEISKIKGNKVTVISGLDQVDHVVTTGVVYIKEGDDVKVINEL